jgi:hypothetical protein
MQHLLPRRLCKPTREPVALYAKKKSKSRYIVLSVFAAVAIAAQDFYIIFQYGQVKLRASDISFPSSFLILA